MPMAARSTSTQFNTCQPYPSASQRGEYTHTRTHTHTGSLWCVCVSVCEHLFRIRHLASFGRAGFTNEAPWTVICLDADQYPSWQTDQKQRKSATLELRSPICIPVAYYIHTQKHTHTHTQELTACNHTNISPLIKYSSKRFFLSLSRFQLELKFTAG